MSISDRATCLIHLCIRAAVCLASLVGTTSRAEDFGDGGDYWKVIPESQEFADTLMNAKGYGDGHLKFASGGAEISPFNLNLTGTFSEDVGFPLQTSGGLSVRLQRVYNSTIYTEGSWQCASSVRGKRSRSYRFLRLRRDTPLGLGWSLHLGHIYQKSTTKICEPLQHPVPPAPNSLCAGDVPMLVLPDGSEHELIWTQGPDGLFAFYTRDGSAIKANQRAGGAGWDVYMPDGTVWEMTHYVGSAAGELQLFDDSTFECEDNATRQHYFTPSQTGKLDEETIGYYTEKVRTREAAWVRVTYHADFPYIVRWIYDAFSTAEPEEDPHSPPEPRIDVAISCDVTGVAVPVGDPAYGHVCRITYPAAPGASEPTVVAFSYEHASMTIDPTPAYETGGPWTHQVTLLRQAVTLPDGYVTRYDYRRPVDDPHIDVLYGTRDYYYQLNEVVYPSGKKLELVYGNVRRTTQAVVNCDYCEKLPRGWKELGTVGIREKREYATATDSSWTRRWTFEPGESPGAKEPALDACWIRQSPPAGCYGEYQFFDPTVIMVDPSNNATRLTFDGHTMGPYWSQTPDSSAVHGKVIKEEYWRGADTSTTPWKVVTRRWHPKMDDYDSETRWSAVEFESEDWIEGPTTSVSISRTYTGWNAWAGAYENVLEVGNATGVERTTTSDFAVNNGPTCRAASMWYPRATSARRVRERRSPSGATGTVSLVEYETNSYGRTSMEVVHVGDDLDAVVTGGCGDQISTGGISGADLVTRYSYTAAGDPATMRKSIGPQPDDVLDDVTTYSYDRGVEVGVRKGVTGHQYVLVDRVVDPASRLVQTETFFPEDHAGVTREYSYDSLRRLKRETTDGMASWIYDYENEVQPDGSNRLVSVAAHQGDNDQEVRREEHFDTWGRLKTEVRSGKSGPSYRHTRYHSNGLRSFVSTWTSTAVDNPTLPGTRYEYEDEAGYTDPEGRATLSIAPDGAETEVRYFGTNRATTVRNRDEGATNGAIVSSQVDYVDRYGRLRAVDISGNGTAADAVYSYDGQDHLTTARLVSELNLTPTEWDRYASAHSDAESQTREFRYDSGGRLMSDTGPEYGTRTVHAWTPTGQPIRVQDALGASRGYYFESLVEDGRLRNLRRVLGQPGAPSAARELVSGASSDFESGVGDWEIGRVEETTFTATPGPDVLWQRVGFSTGCIPAGSPDGGTHGLYIGRPSDCTYESAPATGYEVARIAINNLKQIDELSFVYWRQVRQSATPGSGNADEFSVWVVPQRLNNSVDARRVVFRETEAQASYSTWQRMPPVRIGDYLEPGDWNASGTAAVYLYLAFGKNDPSVSGLGKGIIVDSVTLGAKQETLLLKLDYDEDHCLSPAMAEACATSAGGSNRPMRRPTTRRSYDGDRLVALDRLVYKGPAGIASGVRRSLDWMGALAESAEIGGPGSWPAWSWHSEYDQQGQVIAQSMPRLDGEASSSQLGYSYVHGALSDIQRDGTGQSVFGDTGIEYHPSGAVRVISYANGATQTIERDEAGRPVFYAATPPQVGPACQTPYWSSGDLAYDGAGNITAIGDQEFRYDAARRLVFARTRNQTTVREANTVVESAFTYDLYGNRLSEKRNSQLVSDHIPLPVGVLNRNRYNDASFAYDENGNTVRFDGQLGQGHSLLAGWDALNRVAIIHDGAPTDLQPGFEHYRYDLHGNRWYKRGRDGVPLLSLRSESAQPLAEYRIGVTGTPSLAKQYIVGLGQVLAERVSAKIPVPVAASQTATGSLVENFVAPGAAQGTRLLVEVRTEEATVLQSLATVTSGGVFAIDRSLLTPNVTNYVRIRQEDAPDSVYSAPAAIVTRIVDPAAANQIQSLSVSRDGTNLVVRWTLASSNGKSVKLFFRRLDGPLVQVTPQALSSAITSYVLPSQALSGLCGSFFARQYAANGTATGPTPDVENPTTVAGITQGSSCATGEDAPQPSFATTYHHRDHLGSLRIVTDEAGRRVEGHDYYPFGEEMPYGDPASSEKQFTGHERDSATGLDYMLARYHSPALGRFLSVDPGFDVETENPQSWNLYTYVRNNPTGARDPDGRYSFEAGKDVTDSQVQAAYAEQEKLKKSITDETAKHFKKEYGVDIRELLTPGKGGTVLLCGNNDKDVKDILGRYTPSGKVKINMSEKGTRGDGGLFQATLLHETGHKARGDQGWLTQQFTKVTPNKDADAAIRAAQRNLDLCARYQIDMDNKDGYYAEYVQYGELRTLTRGAAK